MLKRIIFKKLKNFYKKKQPEPAIKEMTDEIIIDFLMELKKRKIIYSRHDTQQYKMK